MTLKQMRKAVYSDMGKRSQRNRLASMSKEEISAFNRAAANAKWAAIRAAKQSGTDTAKAEA